MEITEFEEKYGAVVNGKYIGGQSTVNALYAHGLTVINGDLVLPPEGVYELPANLRIYGNLNLAGTSVEILNSNLAVTGTLTLTDSQVTTIPDNVVAGKLIAKNSKLRSIGSDLTVKGDLDLRGSDITYIGSHLRVTGTLSLQDTKIKKLSEEVEVGALNLENSELEALPEYLTVKSSLVLSGTKVKKIGNEITIEGTFDLTGTQINELPEGLYVGVDYDGNNIYGMTFCIERETRDALILKDTPIKTLPDGICVEYLDLSHSKVETLGEWTDAEKLILTDGVRVSSGGKLDVCFIEVRGGKLDAIESAFKLKPRSEIFINGAIPGLPENYDLDCELILKNSKLDTFPQKAFVSHIQLINTQVSFIPSGFRAGDMTILGKKSICFFDDYFKCTQLEIRDTPVSQLPDMIDFKRLILIDSPIEDLPDDLHSPGAMYLDNTNITKFPENLEIGYLQIIGPKSQIAMPDSLVIITDSLLWEDFPFESWPDNLLVFGGIILTNGKLASVPTDELVRAASQKELRNQLTYWKNGRFVTYPGAGNFEIIARNGNRIKLRKICTYDEFWVEEEDPRWNKLFGHD